MSKTNSAVLRCHFHWLLDQRSASNRETTLRIYLKIIKRVCVCVCVHLKAQGEHEPYFIGRRIFTLRYFIHWTIHSMNISSTLFGYITECPFFMHFIFIPVATNAKTNNGTLKILIASLPTHSYEHTHTKKPPKLSSSNKATMHTNYSSPGMSSSHHFVCFFCSLLFMLFHPALFVFLFCALFLQPNLMSTPESVPTLPSFLLVSSGGSGAADFPLLCPPCGGL